MITTILLLESEIVHIYITHMYGRIALLYFGCLKKLNFDFWVEMELRAYQARSYCLHEKKIISFHVLLSDFHIRISVNIFSKNLCI